MKAMLLAAGRGSRMGTLTDDIPKPLVEVAGTPMMLYAVRNLKTAGVSKLVVNTHYKSELLKAFIREQNNFGVRVDISEEADLLDTGGGIFKAREHFKTSDCFFVHNADVYSEIDLTGLRSTHLASGADATLAVKKRKTSRGLLFSPSGDLLGWENKKTGEVQIADGLDAGSDYESFGFCGVYVLSAEFMNHLKTLQQERFSIITAFLSAASAGLSIKAYDIGDAAWFDIGTPEKLQAVEEYLGQKS